MRDLEGRKAGGPVSAFKPSQGYSYGMPGSKANLRDKASFTREFFDSKDRAMMDLLGEYGDVLDGDRPFGRGPAPYGPGKYWGPSTDIGSKLPPVPESIPGTQFMKNMGGAFALLGDLSPVLDILAWDIWLREWFAAGSPQYDVPSGWTRCATPDWTASFACNGSVEPPPANWDWQGTGAFTQTCGSGGVWGQCPRSQVSVYDSPLGDTTGWPTNVTSVVFSRPTPGVAGRWDLLRNYRRPSVAGQTGPFPSYRNRSALPVADPVPSSSHDPGVGHAVAESFFPVGEGVVVPSVDIKTGAGGPPVGEPGWHVKEPTGDDKVKMPYSMALKLYHALTEVGDATDCLFQALSHEGKGGLPSTGGGRYGQTEIQPRYNKLTQVQRAVQVAENLDKIDWGKAVKCLAANEIEDRLIGAGFGALDKYVTKRGGPSTTHLTGYMKNIPRPPRGPRKRKLGHRYGQLRSL